MLIPGGIEPVIPARKGRKAPAPHDAENTSGGIWWKITFRN